MNVFHNHIDLDFGIERLFVKEYAKTDSMGPKMGLKTTNQYKYLSGYQTLRLRAQFNKDRTLISL